MPLSAVCRGLMGPPLKIFSPYPFAGPACGQHGVLRKDTGRTARSVIAIPIKLCRICANWCRSVRRSALGGFPPKMAWGWSDRQVRMCGAGDALVIGGICPDCQFLDIVSFLIRHCAVRVLSGACGPGLSRVRSAKRCRMKRELIGRQALDFGSGHDRDGSAPEPGGPIFTGEMAGLFAFSCGTTPDCPAGSCILHRCQALPCRMWERAHGITTGLRRFSPANRTS